ncbi:MAG TPA: insulinase family protein, partial [Anaerolineales bacterium]|nr:insulinase family protein [Anaerolineales bacterium]
MTDNLYGFELVKEESIEEMKTLGRLYRHKKTGAQFLSLINDDENKVFSINFRTTPEDSTGVAHILEHSVLSGSEKYPVKEPFIELIKGSLKTFVNAFTFPDKTCYPAASQNLQDFYNLIDVYMDAVLHPLLEPKTLEQEGWHYEFDEDGKTLIYKGVVFNEMKGALSNPMGLLGEVNQQSLFPENLYGYNSGGDPINIPDLTYEQFIEFHRRYYHPSNALIFMYGDDDPETRLKRMAEYLEPFDALDIESDVPLQEPFEQPVEVRELYPAGEEEAPKYYVCQNWALAETTDPEQAYGLSILGHVLLGTSASPLRKALIDSGYGEDVVGGGLNPHLRQSMFSAGLKGVKEEHVNDAAALVLDTLTELVEHGIDSGTIAASMNTVEFSLRENNTGSFPRGIMVMLRSLFTWLYDGDPFSLLQFEEPLAAIKAKLAAGDSYFEDLIRENLLKNPHRSTVILEPDTELNRRLAEEEKARLAEVQSSMSAADLDTVAEKARELAEYTNAPNSPEALATLPVLQLSDLEKTNKLIPIEVLDQDGVEMLYHDLFTNGILYLDLAFDLNCIAQEDLPYLQLFTSGLVKMGTSTEDFVQLSQRIGQHTGGVSPSVMVQNKFQEDEVVFKLVIRAKSTMDKVETMLGIIKDILLTTDYDQIDRFRQILMERKARLEAGLVPSGHGVVARRLGASQSQAGWLNETISGLENLFFTRQLLENLDAWWPEIVTRFNRIRALLVQRGGMLVNATIDRANWAQVQPKLTPFIASIPEGSSASQTWQPQSFPAAEGLTVPAQVNYVGKGTNLYHLGYTLNGAHSVVRNYLRTTYLWDKVRIQGGAYGVFASFDSFSGAFNYVSYRDPNVLKTLNVYDGTEDFLRKEEISREEVTKAIIGVIGTMDAYQLPDAKGYASMSRYLSGYSDEVRQKIRDEVLAASEEDFREFANVLELVRENGQVAVLGSA